MGVTEADVQGASGGQQESWGVKALVEEEERQKKQQENPSDDTQQKSKSSKQLMDEIKALKK